MKQKVQRESSFDLTKRHGNCSLCHFSILCAKCLLPITLLIPQNKMCQVGIKIPFTDKEMVKQMV